jgi:nickel transport protein
MKSIIRWSATAGLVGSVFAGTLLSGVAQVLALPQEQILQKLRPVPVFTIANAQGAPLVVAPPDGKKGQSVAGVFINQKDAQAFLDRLKSKDPNLAKGVQVVPVSLAEVYQLSQQNKSKPDGLEFAYVPSEQQVASALALLKQSGQQVQQFNATPLFVARGGKDKGYLTIQEGNQSLIPMFFKKEDLQGLIDRFKQQQPNQATGIEIQVISLEGLMEVLQTKNEPQYNQILLVPPRESIEFVRSLGGQKPANQPQVAPAKPANPAPAPKK